MKRWHDVNAIYQIYPRSFKDSDSDGTGDLAGIVSQIDYINGKTNSLGIDAIWLSPFFLSPMVDFGYDVADYIKVDPLFGDNNDFQKLIKEAHARNIKVMIDYVPNHTSDTHEWFKESKKSLHSSKRDWYVWRDPRPDGSPPNNWISVFGGSAWEYDASTGQYYLHSFFREQPDLNWDNPSVRSAMLDVLRYWLDMGVDGIRADAVRWLSKDALLRDNPPNPTYKVNEQDPYWSQLQRYSNFGENLFKYLACMTDVIEKYDDRIILFEDYPDPTIDWWEQQSKFYEVNPNIAAPFNFQGMSTNYSAEAFSAFIGMYEEEMAGSLQPFYCFANHDKPRLVSRFGEPQAKLIGLMHLTLRGIPVVYYGDELGMKDVKIQQKDVRDPKELRNPGMGLGRDPERTPMQWMDEKNAGFSSNKPWLPVDTNYRDKNVASELASNGSFLHMYRELLKLRDRPAIRAGTYTTWDGSNKDIFGYWRIGLNEKFLILLNMSDNVVNVALNVSGTVLVSTHALASRFNNDEIVLQPHQGVVIEVQV